ncbi:hypothetical protein COCON_G00129510 [Conger conger]|uniref:RING-type E3 ubiquitin transferase n=1 Tax=Conger conger TaxID=82655 RepID=A0A9Q1DDJ5_CONCO|nr:hypothetical protein COCON_G00129510 [Conger conger]
MAEAAAVPQHRFFCHCCKGEVNPKLPEYICPRCESGFIEEVTEDSSLLEGGATGINDDVATQFAELWHLLFVERSPPFAMDSDALDADPRVSGGGTAGSEEVPVPGHHPTRPHACSGGDSTAVSGWSVCQLWRTRVPPIVLDRHAALKPGDYAWGQGGLDAVITQLLGQFENTGPPPAEKEKISSLPTVIVSQEQADLNMECPVCKEDYSVGEPVRQLPCNHFFHSGCIVPWLEMHDTCPVCRKSLSGEDHSGQLPTDPSSHSTDPRPQERWSF